MTKSTSIKDIAKAAQVSVATVSRVINKSGHYSKKTEEKVLKIIKQYGYHTNMAAKSLRMSKSKTIGLIVPNINNEWFSHLLLECENYFFTHHYSVFICNTSGSLEKEKDYLKSLDAKLVDGIMCISGSQNIPLEVLSRDIPIVCIDRKPIHHENIYYVESDHYEGGYLATKHLIEKGAKTIGIILKDKIISTNEQRYQGYIDALKDFHITHLKNHEIYIDKNLDNFTGSYQAIYHYLKDHKLDAIFASNDMRALGALKAIQDLHYRIPEDIKLIGFDDISISKICTPTLTTIKQDIPAIANYASELLLNIISGKDVKIKHMTVPITLIEREST